MKIAELIKILETQPPDRRVIVDGYENGYDDVARTAEIEIALNVNPEAYFGDHEEATYAGKPADETAFLISRA